MNERRERSAPDGGRVRQVNLAFVGKRDERVVIVARASRGVLSDMQGRRTVRRGDREAENAHRRRSGESLTEMFNVRGIRLEREDVTAAGAKARIDKVPLPGAHDYDVAVVEAGKKLTQEPILGALVVRR
jgi:hypothetical protein